jgi:methionyl-tRNA formyltransferase
LCESIVTSINLWKRLEGLEGVDLHVLISKNGKVKGWRYLLGLLLQMIRVDLRNTLLTWNVIRKKKLHVSVKPLHHPKNISWISKQSFDVGLHAAGVIYRKKLIDCFSKGILNSHIGILPKYRGRSVMEWSVFEGNPTGISTFFIDEGIDTGSHIVFRKTIDISRFKDIAQAKNYLFSLNGEMFAEALRMLNDPEYKPIYQKNEEGKRYYVMSKLFEDVVTHLLKS